MSDVWTLLVGIFLGAIFGFIFFLELQESAQRKYDEEAKKNPKAKRCCCDCPLAKAARAAKGQEVIT